MKLSQVISRIPLIITLTLSCMYCDDFIQQIGPVQYKGPYFPIPPPPIEEVETETGCVCKMRNQFTSCFGSDSACSTFPKTVQISSRVLGIKTTMIVEIHKNDFENVTNNVEILRIEGNSLLTRIQPGVFANSTNLRNISISFNSNLRFFEEETFKGLVNLEELILVKNGFNKILDVTVALQPRYVPRLEKLTLSENQFLNIELDEFHPMNSSSLEELNLILCQIEYVHPEALAPLKNLKALRLGENFFEASTVTELIATSVNRGVPLQSLNLYSNGFRKAPPRQLLSVIAKSNITQLSLARNQFEVMLDRTFPMMPKLEFLDLRESLVLNITPGAFQGLPNLKTLLLSGNKLPNIPDGVLLESVTHLDLSMNSAESYRNSFSYFSIGKNRFQKMKELTILNLSYNRLSYVLNESFIGLENLRILGLKNASIFNIEPYSFRPLKKLIVLNMENNPFPSNKYLTPDLFVGLDSLEVLLLGGCGIVNLASDPPMFSNLKNLKHLGLERNFITMLTPEIFAPIRKLESLDLGDNQLLPWKERLFGPNSSVTTFMARNNKLTYISYEMMDDFENLTRIDVVGNPFTCECHFFRSLIFWIKSHPNATILNLLKERSTFCVSPNRRMDLTLMDFISALQNNSYICRHHGHHFHPPTTIVTLVVITIIFVILASVGYLYRWQLKYAVFLVRLQMGRKGKLLARHKEPVTKYEYDAFVSYSNEDRDFVTMLVSMLEDYEPYLKLCVYERDFQIGAIISEEVLENMKKSRKTLLIVSDSYVKSQWCRWEVQIAEHHNLFSKMTEDEEFIDDSLVLVKIGNVSSNKMSSTLVYLMKTRIYLQWEEDPRKQLLFWDKLRRVLAPPKQCL